MHTLYTNTLFKFQYKLHCWNSGLGRTSIKNVEIVLPFAGIKAWMNTFFRAEFISSYVSYSIRDILYSKSIMVPSLHVHTENISLQQLTEEFILDWDKQ